MGGDQGCHSRHSSMVGILLAAAAAAALDMPCTCIAVAPVREPERMVVQPRDVPLRIVQRRCVVHTECSRVEALLHVLVCASLLEACVLKRCALHCCCGAPLHRLLFILAFDVCGDLSACLPAGPPMHTCACLIGCILVIMSDGGFRHVF